MPPSQGTVIVSYHLFLKTIYRPLRGKQFKNRLAPKLKQEPGGTWYIGRGGPFSPIYLKIGDRLDAQMFLGVAVYDIKENIFKNFQN